MTKLIIYGVVFLISLIIVLVSKKQSGAIMDLVKIVGIFSFIGTIYYLIRLFI